MRQFYVLFRFFIKCLLKMKTTKKQRLKKRIMFNWQYLEKRLPPDVANKWILKNTDYPKIEQRKDDPKKKEMIILYGKKGSGKTTAIESVFVALVFARSPFQNTSYDFVGGATIGADRKDIFAVVDIPGKVRLGFCSAGDYPDKWLEKINDILIKSAKCDIIICAARKGSRPSVLRKLKEAEKKFKYTPCVSPSPEGTISENIRAYRQFIFKNICASL